MKNRRTILGVMAAGAVIASPARAQFGGLSNMVGGGKPAAGGADVGKQVTDFLARSSVLSALSANALAKVNAAFASDEELARKRKEQEDLAKISDAKEKQARAAQIYESESAAAKKLAESADLGERMKKLDDEKKKRVGEGLFNFGIAALQAPDLIKSGQSIMQGVTTNPLEAAKVVPVKDAIPLLTKVGSDAGSTVATFAKLAQGADISVPQVTASSKPVSEDL